MTTVIYHSADFDEIFCREIARHFLGDKDVEYIGWNHGDPKIPFPNEGRNGQFVRYAQQLADAAIAKGRSFTMNWEGLNFLCINTPRCNSLTFTAGIRPKHDALMGFYWDGKQWKISLYGAPGKPEVDLSAIAVKYGGGGHRGACGFTCNKLPFNL